MILKGMRDPNGAPRAHDHFLSCIVNHITLLFQVSVECTWSRMVWCTPLAARDRLTGIMKLALWLIVFCVFAAVVVIATLKQPVGAPQAPTPSVAGADTSTPTVPPRAPPTQAPAPCPVRLGHGRLTAENSVASDFAVTVTNVSHKTISAVSLDLTHTDTFGTTREPYEGHLAAEEHLAPGQSVMWHWDDLIVSKPVVTDGPAGHPSTHITLWDLVNADGTRPDVSGCSFTF